ncbi:MAG: UvrD-helicase domain-containing protein, partial [Sphingosinicella sp.]
MTYRLRPLDALEGEQEAASDPRCHAALSASAGTGKTHVLTARVLRLLLAGADPASILCLTFTKAGASEMAERIHARLAFWVRLDDSELARELRALKADFDPAGRQRARTLFAQVLDATGGGLRIQTIHAFAQGLLAAFPLEAGVTPGFRPIEEREERQLARSTLAETLVRAESQGDLGLIDDVRALSLRLGEGGAESFLIACTRSPEGMAALGPRQGIEARLRQLFDLPLGDIEEAIAYECADDRFDIAMLQAIATANRQWGKASGLAYCDAIADWLAASPAERAARIGALSQIVLTKEGHRRIVYPGQLEAAGDYDALAERLAECCRRLIELRALAGIVSGLAPGLRAGQAFALAYREAKQAAGLADFDDLIRHTVNLLQTPGMGDWVRYKLDLAIEHVLVDEAQDTNEAQWTIVDALVAEFFAGEGAVDRARTLFTVGDFKQAIFGFQGTDPREFERARGRYSGSAGALRRQGEELEAAGRWDARRRLPPEFRDLS